MNVVMFPGEAEAIAEACRLAKEFGYGNLIMHLRDAWSKELQREYGFDVEEADRGAIHICPWCDVDHRTGKKVPRKKRKAKR